MGPRSKKREKLAKIIEIRIELKFEPTLVIYMGKSRIGHLTFNDVGAMGKFLTRLKESIERLVVEFKSAKVEYSEDKQE